jgi:hypothetical protein
MPDILGKKERRKSRLSEEYVEFLLGEQKLKKAKTWYEKFCKYSESLGLEPPKALEKSLKQDIIFSSLNVTPKGVFSASILGFILTLIISLTLSLFTADITIFVVLLCLPFGVFYYMYTYPSFQAQVLRVQAGDEAIKIILYMVIYLKLNPSFENAINFATTHVKGPISNDIKKAMWDLHVGKYNTIEDALSVYMPKWAMWNEDFVRALSLLYGVLIEPSEEGRERILKKSLSFLLDATHQKMKSYVEEISSPIMILHVLGLLLPVMGLIMFPMLSLFLHQEISVPLLLVGYVIVLPLFNLFFITRILMKRPGAFIAPDVSKHPELPPPHMFTLKLKKKILVPIAPLAALVGLLIMLPGILHFSSLFVKLMTTELTREILLKEAEISLVNIGSSFSITAGVAVATALFFYLRSFQRIKIRNDIKNIEKEFQTGLFSIGNFLSEGYPIEISIQKSLEEYQKLGMQKRPTYIFFSKLLHNIKDLGMTFRRALFDAKEGVMRYYPSILIEEVMKILSDASEKSSVLLGRVSKTVASYLEDMSKIEAKIKELLEETRSSIRMQAGFVVPLICGVVSSLGIFLINMLKLLADKMTQLERTMGLGFLATGTTGFSDILTTLIGDFTKVVPMTVLQAIIGIYTVEIVVLLSYFLSGIENGFDEVARDYTISQNLIRATIVYGIASIITLIIFRGLRITIEAV